MLAILRSFYLASMWVQATTALAETTTLADFGGLTVFSAIPVVDCRQFLNAPHKLKGIIYLRNFSFFHCFSALSATITEVSTALSQVSDTRVLAASKSRPTKRARGPPSAARLVAIQVRVGMTELLTGLIVMISFIVG